VLTSAAMPNETGTNRGTGRSSFLVSLFLALLLCCAAIGSHSLWSPDEPTGAGVGRAMRDSGDWIVPRLNGEPFLEKPPLYWWTLAASLGLLGISDAAARAPSALFGVLTLMVAWTAGRRLGGPRQGLLAVVVLGTTMLFVQNATRVTVDPALMFFVALAHLGFLLLAGLTGPGSPGEARWARLLARSIIVLALSLAFLAKGIVALGLGAGPPVVYLLATRRARFVRELLLLAALGIPMFALLVAPWAVALQRAAGWEGLRECLVNNTVSRFVRTDLSSRYGHTEPFWFYLVIAPPWLLPWTLALPAMLRSGVFRRDTPGSEGRRLLLATAGIGLLMLSIPSSKREVYLLPLLPAFAVCVAGWLDGVGDGTRQPGEVKPLDRRTLLALGGFAAALPLAVGAAALWLAWAPQVSEGAAALRGALPAAGIAGFGIVSLALGAGLALGLARRRASPSVSWILAALLLLVLGLETAVEGFVDPVKRTDELTAALAAYFPGPPGGEPIPGYLPPVVSNEAIFGIIGFKLGRTVHPLGTPEEVRAWLAGHPGAPILARMEQLERLPPDMQKGLAFVYDERGRKSAPFGIAVWRRASRGLSASRPAPAPGRGGA
jgi:4-amino-4-deoxy-L-arabinose transferase-like glycosyltransferase